jgi:mannose-6-phosphate isomerase-like protein (cupin superfamily)
MTDDVAELGWAADIEAVTLANSDFRRVIFTGRNLQMTVMSLAPGEDIGWEMHDTHDQFLRIEQGQGRLRFGRTEDRVDEEHRVSDDWAIIVPAGTWHDVLNTGDTDLKLYSLYAPPEHPPITVHPTKADAEADEH